MRESKKSSAVLLGAAVGAVASIWSLTPNLARAGTSTNTSGPVQQGQSDGGTGNPSLNNPAVTISFSGQTALKSYFISPAITELQPGTSIILHDGTNGAPITYTATNDANTTVQLANKSFTTPDKNPGTPSSPSTSDLQVASALRVEWHEEGSIDGFVDLLNDQVGYPQSSAQQAGVNGSTTAPNVVEAIGPLSQEALRTPSSSNPTIVNQNTFTAAGSSAGFSLDNSASDFLNQTYNSAVYTPATGTNIQGGQNRVQFSVGEYPTEALSIPGTASPFAAPGSAGYGQGNTALTSGPFITALGTANARQSFQPSTAANESTSIDDPQTGAVYASGPWNTAGANNITSTGFAVTAVTYSANPGTGLQRIDLGDAQWLQTTGRLQNGALFNVVARTVNTGQRAVFALNTGIDPTWAVGSNDDGNSTSSTAAALQHSIGSSLRYDGKTSGTEAATTIGASRMAVGALSVPEARAEATNAPVRALDVDFTDQSDVNPSDDSTKFIRADFNTIVSDGSSANGPHYAATLISHVNTVKAPNPTALLNEEKTLGYISNSDNNVADATNTSVVSAANQATAWAQVNSFDPATAETDSTPATAPISGIKGDVQSSSTSFYSAATSVGGDAAAVISNVVNSVGTAAAGITTASANNPADGLFATGYLIPGLLDYTRTTDGGAITSVTPSSAVLAEQASVNANYGTLFTTDASGGSNAQTIGVTSFYGASSNGLTSNGIAINGAIPITAKNANGSAAGNGVIAPAGNYLFGNFNQNGVRDYSAVEQSVNAALSLYAVDAAKNSIFIGDGGVTDSTVIPSLVGTPGWATTADTKGDLIALGDFNSDGQFDGEDVYLLAIGASLADSTSSTTLTATAATFSDALRNPNAVLRKNAALDYVNNYLNTTSDTTGAAFLRQTARAVLVLPGTSSSNAPIGSTYIGTDLVATNSIDVTFDPTGVYAFDKHDVNRDGVVDFNDADLVDNHSGQSYTNLTQSLAATQQTPVTGVVEPANLVAVQQIDGESSISSTDLAELNIGLATNGPTNWYAYTITKTGTESLNFARTAGAVTVFPTSSGTGPATYNISGGQVNVGKAVLNGSSQPAETGTLTTIANTIDPFTDSSATSLDTTKSLAINVSNATLDYAARTGAAGDTGIKLYRIAALNIQNGGAVTLDSPASHANRSLLVTGFNLNFSGTGTLDLGANDLLIHNGTLSAVQSQLKAGFNAASGYWNGTGGIVSSAAKNNPQYLTALGYAQSTGGTFDGYNTATSDILVKYTYYGDANLDGAVNGADYQQIDNGFGQYLTGWKNGDFNYDGVVDGSDYSLIDNTFNQLTATGASPLALDATSSALLANPASGIASVPEPTNLALLAISALGVLNKRRRRS